MVKKISLIFMLMFLFIQSTCLAANSVPYSDFVNYCINIGLGDLTTFTDNTNNSSTYGLQPQWSNFELYFMLYNDETNHGYVSNYNDSGTNFHISCGYSNSIITIKPNYSRNMIFDIDFTNKTISRLTSWSSASFGFTYNYSDYPEFTENEFYSDSNMLNLLNDILYCSWNIEAKNTKTGRYLTSNGSTPYWKYKSPDGTSFYSTPEGIDDYPVEVIIDLANNDNINDYYIKVIGYSSLDNSANTTIFDTDEYPNLWNNNSGQKYYVTLSDYMTFCDTSKMDYYIVFLVYKDTDNFIDYSPTFWFTQDFVAPETPPDDSGSDDTTYPDYSNNLDNINSGINDINTGIGNLNNNISEGFDNLNNNIQNSTNQIKDFLGEDTNINDDEILEKFPETNIEDPSEDFFSWIFSQLENVFLSTEPQTFEFSLYTDKKYSVSSDQIKVPENAIKTLIALSTSFGIFYWILKDVRKTINKVKEGSIEALATEDITADMV